MADQTRAAHEELHHHSWIGCLMSPTLTPDQYHRVLGAYLQFYRHIESERDNLREFDNLNLRQAIKHLESDTAEREHVIDLSLTCSSVKLDTANTALGALYVLHGARFGAALINKQVSVTLPGISRQFLKHSTPVAQWRELISAIESLVTNDVAQRDLFSGADLTFTAFGKSVTEYCESTNKHVAEQASF